MAPREVDSEPLWSQLRSGPELVADGMVRFEKSGYGETGLPYCEPLRIGRGLFRTFARGCDLRIQLVEQKEYPNHLLEVCQEKVSEWNWVGICLLRVRGCAELDCHCRCPRLIVFLFHQNQTLLV